MPAENMKQALLALLVCGFAALSSLAAEPIRFDQTQIPWKAGPPSLPPGSQVAVLEGDPKGEGLFTMRVKLPAGARLAPHWHPRPERVTVLSGAIGIGYGDHFDQTQLQVFRAGSYYLTPPAMHHFAASVEETVVQITTMGPWELHPVTDPEGIKP